MTGSYVGKAFILKQGIERYNEKRKKINIEFCGIEERVSYSEGTMESIK